MWQYVKNTPPTQAHKLETSEKTRSQLEQRLQEQEQRVQEKEARVQEGRWQNSQWPFRGEESRQQLDYS